MTKLSFDLSNLATSEESPWFDRKYTEKNSDPRGRFQRDRDRILHSDSFRKLQYKTQVFVVHEGDFFRTRLTHSLEVAQIGRTLASIFNLREPLVEAICLAHDLGHAPFGHTGEEALNKCIKNDGLIWNANAHSLTVVEESEIQYFTHTGLNLTWATREGIARHSTNFDKPVEGGDYNTYKQASLEAQAANIADVIAYCSHDVEDALITRIIGITDLNEFGSLLWESSYKKAVKESKCGIKGWQENERLLIKRIHRHMIDSLVRNAFGNTKDKFQTADVATMSEMKNMDTSLISFAPEVESQIDKLLQFMIDRVYKSPVVDRQNYRANLIVTRLFQAIKEDNKLLPVESQQRIREGGNNLMEIARFIASLTDRSATDLYADLFEPSARSMGHFI